MCDPATGGSLVEWGTRLPRVGKGGCSRACFVIRVTDKERFRRQHRRAARAYLFCVLRARSNIHALSAL